MQYLIWADLNTVIVLYFTYLLFGFIFTGKKIFTPKFKIISIPILILGIAQLIIAPDIDKKANRIILSENYNTKNGTYVKNIKLEDNLAFSINMDVAYSMDKSEYIPIESSSYLTGYVSGFIWEYTSFNTNKYMQGEQSEFTASGLLTWHLFGIQFYKQEKKFKGIIE